MYGYDNMNRLMAIYPGQSGWAGTELSKTFTTLIVLKFITSIPTFLPDLLVYLYGSDTKNCGK